MGANFIFSSLSLGANVTIYEMLHPPSVEILGADFQTIWGESFYVSQGGEEILVKSLLS